MNASEERRDVKKGFGASVCALDSDEDMNTHSHEIEK
jgi:hypothetical protein